MSIQPIELWDEKNNKAIPFDFSRLVWSEAEEGTIGEATKLTYYRLNLKVKNADGTEGPFVVHLGKHTTFGIQRATDLADKSKQIGWSCNFCLHTYKDGKIVPTESDKAKEEFLLELEKRMKEYIIRPEVRTSIAKPKVTEVSQLQKFRIVRYSEDKKTGERIPDKSPMLNTKLICKRADNFRIVSKFYLEDQVDEKGNLVELDPNQLVEKRNTMDAYILISGVFAGSDVYPQLKLWEAHLTPYVARGLQTLRARPETRVVFSAEKSEFASYLKGAKKVEDQVRKHIDENVESDDDENGATNPLSLLAPAPATVPVKVEDPPTEKRRHKRKQAVENS